MMKEKTPHNATMPAHTMNRRCVSCQMGGAYSMYRFIEMAPMTAQTKKETRPEVSAR